MSSNSQLVGTMSSTDSDRESDDRESEYGSPPKISSYNTTTFRESIDSDSDVGFHGGNRNFSDSTSEDGSSSVMSHHSNMDNKMSLKRLGSATSSYEPASKKYRSVSGDQDDAEDVEDRDSEEFKTTPSSMLDCESTDKKMKRSDSQDRSAGSSRSNWRTEDRDSEDYKTTPSSILGFKSTDKRRKRSDSQDRSAGSSRSSWRTEDRDSEDYKTTPSNILDYESSGKRRNRSESQDRSAGSSRSNWRTEDDDSAPLYSNMCLPRKEPVFQDRKAAKIMEKMGFQAGMGLGKEGQGITEPVEMSKQRGRRGLGHSVRGLEPADLEWRFDKENVTFEEHCNWLENNYQGTIDPSPSWAAQGKKKLTIDDEDKFCSGKIVKEVMKQKSKFDALEGKELRKAVSRSNPYETIRGGIFLNRAAMKMANMDRVFDFMFTKPKDVDGKPMVGDDQLLYFADVCAGPGGFSEYVLWRLGWKAKGFGFTLKSENDFKLSDFFAGPCESFEPHYGYKDGEETGDGDVFNPRNQEVFKEFVLANTNNRGVHFMMADGGFSVEGQENIQEILSKQLYLCQFLVALQIVQENGHFVCKVFDLFTEFSVGLIYLLYRSFTKISIHKPNTSRPANSERYVICKWKRRDCESIRDYLFEVNKKLSKFGRDSDRDIVSVVPMSVMEEDENFMQYIYNSNLRLGERQITALHKVIAFCQDTSLEELKQADMRKKCLEYWNVPDDARKAPNKLSPDDLFLQILQEPSERGCTIESATIYSRETELNLINLESTLKDINDWYCAVLGNPKRGDSTLTFFLGTGRSSVYHLVGRKWMKATNLELSAGTLLLGEVVKEIKGEKQRQVKTNVLHIVDAIRLGGIDIRHYHITERVKHCRLFAKAMNKPTRIDLYPIYSKELFELRDIGSVQKRMKNLIMKNSREQRVFELTRDMACIVPQGLIFFHGTQAPWKRYWSRSHKCMYYHNSKTNDSKFENDKPNDACKSFGYSYLERAASWWDERIINAISIDDIVESVHGRSQIKQE